MPFVKFKLTFWVWHFAYHEQWSARMRNKIRDSLVTAFTEELLRSGLSRRNAFYFANEKYLALKKLYWLPNQQDVAGSSIPQDTESHRCSKKKQKLRRSTGPTPVRGGKTITTRCRRGTSRYVAPVADAVGGPGRMDRLEYFETCFEFLACLLSVWRCLRGFLETNSSPLSGLVSRSGAQHAPPAQSVDAH